MDGLTGLLNARAFYETAAVEIERQKRYMHPMTSACLDLDNFKEVNDRFGHKIGDSALLATAQSLRAATRATDILSRLGGDERRFPPPPHSGGCSPPHRSILRSPGPPPAGRGLESSAVV